MKLNSSFIVAAFVTENSPYEMELASHLLPTLEQHNIPHYIEVVENKGSWLKNVAMKPQVVNNALEKYPAMNVVVLDADSEVHHYPILFEQIPEEYDVACHFLDWRSWYGHNEDRQELLSGTMWFRNNEKVRKLVQEWYIRANEDFRWEQVVLEDLILKSDLKIYKLPLEYCYIHSLPDGSKPHIQCEPVIEHFQASRKYKRIIK